MGAPEVGEASVGEAAVVEVTDDAEGDRWKAMADAFDFGGLSDDDDDGSSGGDLSHVRPNLTPSTPQPSDSHAKARRLLPVRWLESPGAGTRDGADLGSIPGDELTSAAAADELDAGAEPIDELAARFTREYRSTQPFLTRVVAEHWMQDSALGRQGAPGALEAGPSTAGASRVETTLLFAKDNSNFLGRGGLCDRTDGVPFHEAWSHVAAHAAGDTDRRCYFRAPLAVELRRDIDFTAARVVFGGEEKKKKKSKARAPTGPTHRRTRSPSERPPCGYRAPGASRRFTSTCATGC
jgi:hypothetical protein